MANLEIGSVVAGWEVVARRTHKPVLHLFGMLLQAITTTMPLTWSRVTWTVREVSTGTVRRVTANTTEDAAEMIRRGTFEKE